MNETITEQALQLLSRQLGEILQKNNQMLATAESCTGGWLAKIITDIPGCSHWFDRGFVTYTNISKQEMLGVSSKTLTAYGAVSEATVKEMSQGAIKKSHADVSLAISGIAGPGGGSEEKPVGMVHFAWSGSSFETVSCMKLFQGDRDQIRSQAVGFALNGLLDVI